MINIGIAGGAGYVAGELLRILSHHPEAHLSYVYSKSHAGKRISEVHEDLFACPMTFTDEIAEDVDVLFLCLGHGQAREFLAEQTLPKETRIIDLGNDFRLKESASADNRTFVYGLVELNKEKIANATAIANPGCFASAIELALLPLAKHNLLSDEVHVHALTGSTGAGQALSDTTHFSWRSNNISVYKAFTHQHLDEIGGLRVCSHRSSHQLHPDAR
jgi:N-acetyl-gamma-glutamyl-phosphate reductase